MPLRDTQDAGTDLLPIGRAAELAHVHSDTLRRWADNGLVAVIRLPSGQRRFRRSDVEAIVAAQPSGSAA